MQRVNLNSSPSLSPVAGALALSSACKHPTNRYSESFEELEEIASGGFGTVYKARHKVDKVVYAVKKIPFKYKNDLQYEKIVREAERLAALKHENIVNYNSAWLDTNDSNEGQESESSSSSLSSNTSDPKMDLPTKRATLYIHMEYCDHDLRTCLKQRNNKEDSIILKALKPIDIFYQVLNGVEYIHSQSVIHRDVKPENIFISKEKNVKIGDFGLACLVHQTQESNSCCSNTNLSPVLGTAPYAAPEQQENHDYDFKVDIYSLGIILLELLCPCATSMEFSLLVKDVRKKKYQQQQIEKVPNYTHLICQMIQKEPSGRPTATEILRFPHFRQRNTSKRIKDCQDKIKKLIISNTELENQMRALNRGYIEVLEDNRLLQRENKAKNKKIKELEKEVNSLQHK